jgi:dTDP-D-glucose 4,6-dehydratase
MKTLLIIGGTGFVGKSFLECFVKNRLKRALKNKDWNEVMDTLLYLDLKL